MLISLLFAIPLTSIQLQSQLNINAVQKEILKEMKNDLIVVLQKDDKLATKDLVAMDPNTLVQLGSDSTVVGDDIDKLYLKMIDKMSKVMGIYAMKCIIHNMKNRKAKELLINFNDKYPSPFRQLEEQVIEFRPILLAMTTEERVQVYNELQIYLNTIGVEISRNHPEMMPLIKNGVMSIYNQSINSFSNWVKPVAIGTTVVAGISALAWFIKWISRSKPSSLIHAVK